MQSSSDALCVKLTLQFIKAICQHFHNDIFAFTLFRDTGTPETWNFLETEHHVSGDFFNPLLSFRFYLLVHFVLLSFCWQHYFMSCHLCKEILCDCPSCLFLDIQVKICHFCWYKIKKKSPFLIAPKSICHIFILKIKITLFQEQKGY